MGRNPVVRELEAMPRPLALHQITAMEASPEELVSIAAAVGCDRVCIFVYSPAAGISFPVVTRATKAAFLGRLRGEGVGVANLEYFPITAETDLDAYRAPLELGAELGACLAVTHVHDAEEDRAADTLGRFADLAAECGLAIGLEFMGLSPGCNSLARAVRLIDRIDRPNAGIAVDALHLVRTGGTPAEVAALAPAYFAYSQICDGHGLAPSSDYLPEALDR